MGESVIERLLRTVLWPSAQTALAAGLAWHVAHDVLGHTAPFFAPISAAVCLWSTNAVRAELAVKMIVAVVVGIALGTGVHALLGTGPFAMGVAVLLALSVAALIGRRFTTQRPLFVNETVVSAILILAFPHRGFGTERLVDALIGGGLAVVFSILIFPKNPLTVLRHARRELLTALREVLDQIRDRADYSAPPDPGWTFTAAASLQRRLTQLTEARSTAEQLVRFCPPRWPLRHATRAAELQAARLTLLASSVLHLARTATSARVGGGPLPEPLHAAISDLSAAVAALADDDQAVAATSAASARSRAAALHPDTVADARNLLASLIDTCAEELQQVVTNA